MRSALDGQNDEDAQSTHYGGRATRSTYSMQPARLRMPTLALLRCFKRRAWPSECSTRLFLLGDFSGSKDLGDRFSRTATRSNQCKGASRGHDKRRRLGDEREEAADFAAADSRGMNVEVS